MYYVGIDWADQKHDVTILDANGQVVLGNWTLPKSQAGFEELLDRLRKLSDHPEEVRIGIETPHNLLVDFLLDLGYPVFALFPGAMKSFRLRYRSSGARDDGFDSFVVADVLRTDTACWRRVEVGSEVIRELRLLTRDHHGLVEAQVALRNRLRSTLKEYYPEYIHFFVDVACPTSLAFLRAYPDFQSARRLSHQQLAEFFSRQGLRNGKITTRIYELLQQKPLSVPPIVVRVRKLKALSCVNKLIVLSAEIQQYLGRLKELVARHPDGPIFLSYPGASDVTAARLLALFGDNRNLFGQVRELQALAGTCPVTEKSGKNFTVTYCRTACNKFYRDVLHNLAFASLQRARWAMAYYKKHRTLGKTHSHALRCLANLHLRILFAMWKNRTPYNEDTFLAQRARHRIANKRLEKSEFLT